ncbi:MAG: sel1 repeat family protein [Alphaproteobacteria bacterium]|nr:sel1 repeat family protein [Alphaproteobacteria bacterium]MDE1932076.1 sel1 repeat family protein [Alphaproteobacteria bacterium]
MRHAFVAVPVFALLLALNSGSTAAAQSHPPVQWAQAQSSDAINQQGDNAYDRKDYAEAMRLYRQAAAMGNATAEANVGFLYAKGYGVPQDYAQSVHWYLMAAEKGQREAQHNLALKYWNGQGVAKDPAQARYWMQKSAAAGDPDAQKWLSEH